MAILPIFTAPDPILKQKSEPIEVVNTTVKKLMADMLETMYHNKGIGMAAVQSGILKRIIVLDLQEDDETQRPQGFYPLHIVNPEIISTSLDMVAAIEGCLSVPGQQIPVVRAFSVRIRFLDYNNKLQELATDGWLARAIQHEIDHLEGKLLIDYLTNMKKDVVIRKLKKLKKHCM